MAGGLELDDLYGPFQPKPFYASMILLFYDSVIIVLSCGNNSDGYY